MNHLVFDIIFIEKRFTESEKIMETSVQKNRADNGAYEESHSYDKSFKGIFLS